MSEEKRKMPLVVEGQMPSDAGIMLMGYMFYPFCERSAHQFTRIYREETRLSVLDPDYRMSELCSSMIDTPQIKKLPLAGQVAARVCRNYIERGEAFYNNAVFVVSEVNSTNKTISGEPLPNSVKTLKDCFKDNRPAIHFWAAANVPIKGRNGNLVEGLAQLIEIQMSPELLARFLATARHFEKLLEKAMPGDFVWTVEESCSDIIDFDHFTPPNFLPESDRAKEALGSYRTPTKY